MTIPQAKKYFKEWLDLMQSNLADPELNTLLEVGIVKKSDVKYWKSEVKRSLKNIDILENHPEIINTDLAAQIRFN